MAISLVRVRLHRAVLLNAIAKLYSKYKKEKRRRCIGLLRTTAKDAKDIKKEVKRVWRSLNTVRLSPKNKNV